jgi:hypothetical protein
MAVKSFGVELEDWAPNHQPSKAIAGR